MGRFPKGWDLDRRHGSVLEPGAPISGFQDAKLFDENSFLGLESVPNDRPTALGRVAMALTEIAPPSIGEATA